jgi:transporter family protein
VSLQPWAVPAAIAFLCWGVWAFLPKITTRYVDPASAVVYEALGGLLVALVVLVLLGFRPATDPRGIGLATLTGALGVAGALAYLYAVTRGPVAVIATATALYPVLAIVLAAALLHEPVSGRQALGVVLALVALVLVAA